MLFRALEDCPYYLVSRVYLAVTSALKKGLAASGAPHVKPAYIGVLFTLWTEKSLRPSELGKRAGLEPSSMTGLLDRMERANLVKRTPDPRDRRASRIELTADGIHALGPVLDAITRILETTFADIPAKDLQTTKRVLRTVLLNCSKEGMK
ncbi:MAG: MarR family transcriptional regulator [Desulfobacteraceae bacterium]|nr:MarR family transcriptional regulator [Desulfobacteraceae bacterium]